MGASQSLNHSNKEFDSSNHRVSLAPYLHALKAQVNSLPSSKKIPEETSDVSYSKKSKSLGEVEGSLWRARAEITKLKKKLDLILKSY